MPARRKPEGSHLDPDGYARRQSRQGTIDALGRIEPYPDPPEWFDDRQRAEHVALWESAPAETWLVGSDSTLVVELIGLRRLVETCLRAGDPPPGTVMARCGFIEDRLLLSPRARKAAGLEVVGSEFDFEGES